MRFSDIPQFPRACYDVRMPWKSLERHIAEEYKFSGLNIDPDYQREHVWTEKQQIEYIEYRLKGGESGTVLLFNCPNWSTANEGPYELIDGKQRLEAVRKFMGNRLKVFGHYIDEFEYSPISLGTFGNGYFDWKVLTVPTREDILRLYIDINAGGTPHSKNEIDRVRAMLEKERL